MPEIRIGLVGAGTIGGGVVKVLHRQEKDLQEDLGCTIRLARIVDKDTARFKELPVGGAVCSTDVNDILNDPAIQIVIELVGGTTFARTLIHEALSRGKHVITANKALIAEYGPEIFETAGRNGVSVYFEASVGGGMPVIKTIREGLIGNTIKSVTTIINGTCNYILSRMADEGLPFKDILAQAQANGYAEADPTLDVGGGDTGHKLAIMASLICEGGYVPYESIPREGITEITGEDIAFAKELGYTIKLLGIINQDAGNPVLDVRVHPAMIPNKHILASVSDVYNAVLIEGDAVGQILLYGRGAGEMPTASAVVSDIVDVTLNIIGNSPVRIPMGFYSKSKVVKVKPIDSIVSRYYLRFNVSDKPGVLASIASFLGNEGISIASVIQKEVLSKNSIPVIFLTHKAPEHGVRAALSEIERMDYIRNKTQVIRIEE